MSQHSDSQTDRYGLLSTYRSCCSPIGCGQEAFGARNGFWAGQVGSGRLYRRSRRGFVGPQPIGRRGGASGGWLPVSGGVWGQLRRPAGGSGGSRFGSAGYLEGRCVAVAWSEVLVDRGRSHGVPAMSQQQREDAGGGQK